MRWQKGRRSTNIEDRRGRHHPPFPRRSGRGRMGLKGGGLGGGTILIIIVISLLTGQNPLHLLGMLGGGAPMQNDSFYESSTYTPDANDKEADFVSAVLADTEDTWEHLFAKSNARYQAPRLVLYHDSTDTACGLGRAATGPFYCPADAKVYLDLAFFNELQRLGAPGDFAVAYVIAHEVGHHIQNLVGTSTKVYKLRQRSGKKEANALSVLQELQADCYAGVWAHHANQQRNLLEVGDLEEGLTAAASVGDDRLQRNAGRSIQPESFTHGSSQQRMQWFKVGYQNGDIDQCDTFRFGKESIVMTEISSDYFGVKTKKR